jgi:hypothetical protein
MSYFSYFFGNNELTVEEQLKNENENLKNLNNILVNDYNSLKITNQNLKTNIDNNNSLNEILNNDNNEKNKTISYLQLKLTEYEKKIVEQTNELELLNKEVQNIFYNNKKKCNKITQTMNDLSKNHIKKD